MPQRSRRRASLLRRAVLALGTTAVVAATSATTVIATAPASASTLPGTVTAVGPLAQQVTLPAAAYGKRITYWTKGVKDAPALSSAAIYFPPGKPPAGGWPVIAWAHGTTGLADHCAYSIGGPIEVKRDWDYLGTWMQQGYAIVATDYVGLGTPGLMPYLNGKVEAHSVVDSVKAATDLYPSLAKKYVVIGQSQGGGAAITTARYATQFQAKGLSYKGAVGTGVPAYIEDLVPLVARPEAKVTLGSTSTSYILYILSGLRTSFPEWNLDSYLTPYGKYWVDKSETLCDTQAELTGLLDRNKVQIGKLFSRPLDQIPNLSATLKSYMGIPESGYDKPFFIGQGGLDTDVNTPGTLALVAKMKANGQPVTFRLYPDKDHAGTVNASKVDSVPFVKNLFAH